MGKKTDKMYMTASEWQATGGGNKSKQHHSEFNKLPFSCCSLSFLPFKIPVCTERGEIFDLMNILPWLKKYKTNPLTGQPLNAKELIKLKFSQSQDNEYQCPITFKAFTQHTHIVAIKTTGNVYAWEAVNELNVKSRNWRDLLTDQVFTRKDIITLQDPRDTSRGDRSAFDFVKRGIVTNTGTNINTGTNNTGTNNTGTGVQGDSLQVNKEDSLEAKKDSRDKKDAHFSTGLQAYALTSMAFTPQQTAVAARLSDLEYLFKTVTDKGHVQIRTSLGDMHFELYCALAPRTCFNFINLAKTGYYDKTRFHRSIRNFMLQGGDPTGTGHGGESIYGEPFKDEIQRSLCHLGRGVLSMANRGPNSNTFITYGAAMHLNGKHTVFGKMISGQKVLDVCEGVGTTSKDEPTTPVIITTMTVITDPFQELQDKETKTLKDRSTKNEERKRRAELVTASSGKTLVTDTVGGILDKTIAKQKQKEKDEKLKETRGAKQLEDETRRAVKKKKTSGVFGDFKNW